MGTSSVSSAKSGSTPQRSPTPSADKKAHSSPTPTADKKATPQPNSTASADKNADDLVKTGGKMLLGGRSDNRQFGGGASGAFGSPPVLPVAGPTAVVQQGATPGNTTQPASTQAGNKNPQNPTLVPVGGHGT